MRGELAKAAMSATPHAPCQRIPHPILAIGEKADWLKSAKARARFAFGEPLRHEIVEGVLFDAD